MKPSARIATPHAKDRVVLIALGSNLGDGRTLILRAMDALQELTERPIVRSSLWHSNPVDCPPGSPPFINAAVRLCPHVGESPHNLLSKLQSIERAFGRQPKKIYNEPRPLDLDLIAFGEMVEASAQLHLPHPRAHLRGFVLAPLAEIAPEFVLPGQAMTIEELLKALPTDADLRKI